MIEAAMFWNEPNNLSHWDFEIDRGWRIYAEMVKNAAKAVASETPCVLRVLGGISPIDANFICNMKSQGVLEHLDVIAVHGFPLDWNHWSIHEWPDKIREIRAATDLPVWVTEVGVSTFGAEEVQEFGVRRTAELLIGQVPRIHLVQPLRSAPGLACIHTAQGIRGIVILPALLYGALAGGWHAEKGAEIFFPLHA